MAEQDLVLLDHPTQDAGRAVKPGAASAVRSRLDWPDRILYQKNLQEQRHKIIVRKLDRVPFLQIFLFTSYYNRFFEMPKMGAKKAANLFQDLLLRGRYDGHLVFSFYRGEHDRPHNCLSVREHGSCEELQQLFIEYGNAYRNADHTCYRGDDKRRDVCFYFRCTVNQRISIRQLCRQISAYSGQ